MSKARKLRQQQDRLNRADQLQAAIAALSKEINQISKEGSVAPADCWLMRYQARGTSGTYWYYKLQALHPIFPSKTGKGKKSRYQHLGKAGSTAHVEAAMSVARRAKIEGLKRILNSLEASWLELCEESLTKEKNKVQGTRE